MHTDNTEVLAYSWCANFMVCHAYLCFYSAHQFVFEQVLLVGQIVTTIGQIVIQAPNFAHTLTLGHYLQKQR